MRPHFLACLAAVALLPQAASATTPITGTWINPHGSVVVTTGTCHDQLCGWVSWANADAQSDAADAGIAHLVGTELLQGYHATGAGRWTGRVYVPDMGRTFYSTIEQIAPDRLRISGCVFGGLLCKSQIWQRR